MRVHFFSEQTLLIIFPPLLAGQKAFIEVNEQGTEAAAATFVGFVTRGGQINLPTIEFKCDRPFMFLIRDKQTDVTLFSGHVVDPTA